MFSLTIGRFCIDYDRHLGADRVSGWSVGLDGHFTVTLERFLLLALWKAWKRRKL